MSCAGILLQVVQDGPSKHVWEKDIQRNGCRPELSGKCERLCATHGYQYFESLVPCEIAHQSCIVRIILDNQQYIIAGQERITVVLDTFYDLVGHTCRQMEGRFRIGRNTLRPGHSNAC